MPSSDLQSLSPVHHEAALLLAQGYTHAQVAAHLGVHVNTISLWKQGRLFRDRIEELTRELQQESFKYAIHKMGTLQSKAVDRLEYLVEHAAYRKYKAPFHAHRPAGASPRHRDHPSHAAAPAAGQPHRPQGGWRTATAAPGDGQPARLRLLGGADGGDGRRG